MPRTCGKQSQRGSVLLMTVLILTVLTVVGAGSINFATIESDAAVAKRQDVFGAACSRAIREMLISQMTLYGAAATPLSVTLPNVDDDVAPAITLRQGHYSNAAAVIQNVSYQAISGDMSSIGSVAAQNITNSFATAVPSAPRRMAATCVVRRPDGSVREKEIEFVVSYGF